MAISREKRLGKCSSSYYCGAYTIDVADEFVKLVEDQKKKLAGMCLGCVKGGNYSPRAFRNTCEKHGLDMKG